MIMSLLDDFPLMLQQSLKDRIEELDDDDDDDGGALVPAVR